MVAIGYPAGLPLASGAAAVRDEHTRREEVTIAKAEADIDAGLGIEDADVEAWLDALDGDPNAPIPSAPSGRADR